MAESPWIWGGQEQYWLLEQGFTCLSHSFHFISGTEVFAFLSQESPFNFTGKSRQHSEFYRPFGAVNLDGGNEPCCQLCAQATGPGGSCSPVDSTRASTDVFVWLCSYCDYLEIKFTLLLSLVLIIPCCSLLFDVLLIKHIF